MFIEIFLSVHGEINNTHKKARLRPASGTQTCLLASGDPRAVIVEIKPFTACRGGNFAAAYKPAARRRAGSLRSVYVGERRHEF